MFPLTFLSFYILVLLSSNNNSLRGKICTRVLFDQNNFIFRHTMVDCKMFMISGKEELARYICTICPDDREMPGFEGVVAKWDRNKHGESNRDFLILERGLVIPGDTF